MIYQVFPTANCFMGGCKRGERDAANDDVARCASPRTRKAKRHYEAGKQVYAPVNAPPESTEKT